MQENDLDNLIKIISKLPSLGPRSARRIALHLIDNKQGIMLPLMESIILVHKNIKNCKSCGNLDVTDICNICQNPKRTSDIICVVEEVSDLWAIEKAKIFNGKYHVLGGTLSAMSGKGPEDLNINSLVQNLESNKEVKEIIIATNPTIDGQTTAYYLLEVLKDCNLKISKLAHGIPIGGELDYLDEGTLDIALKSRSNF
jgi:recombination protein RecR